MTALEVRLKVFLIKIYFIYVWLLQEVEVAWLTYFGELLINHLTGYNVKNMVAVLQEEKI